MPDALDILEQRVAAAADLIAGLREKVSRLELEIQADRPDLQPDAAVLPPQPPGDQALLEELQRLRGERLVVRDRIRGLLKEIDRVIP